MSCIREPVRRIAVAKASSSSALSCGPASEVGGSDQGTSHPARLRSVGTCCVVAPLAPLSRPAAGSAESCPAAPGCPEDCCPEDCCPGGCSAALCWPVAAPAISPDILHLLII